MAAPEGTVAAVIATHNRLELLRAVIEAVRTQSRRPDEILVVDNASTDGTREALAEEFRDVSVIRLPLNSGASGAFRAGLEAAYERGHDRFWILDDDAVPAPTALEELLRASQSADGDPPMVLASRVEWIDGELHPMNVPRMDARRARLAFDLAAGGRLPIRACSWVSILVHREAVRRHGLPHAEYFMWNDDSEYTARILRTDLGFFVPASVVQHRSATASVPVERGGPAMYYEFRNKLWMIRSGSWGPTEKGLLVLETLAVLRTFLVRGRFAPAALRIAARGVAHGIFGRRPTERSAGDHL
jgi:GT2 family glycosyltransferase